METPAIVLMDTLSLPVLPLREMLREVRGRVPTPVMDDVGWEGKKS